MIIGLTGKAGVGKSTVAKILVRKHDFFEMSLAEPLKDICAYALKIPRWRFDDPIKKQEKFEPRKLTGKEIRHMCYLLDAGYNRQVEFYEYLRMVFCGENEQFETLRHILQFVGTDLFRNKLGENIHISLLYARMQKIQHPKIVVSDIRFPNELDFIQTSLNGCMVRIEGTSTATESQLNHASERDLMGACDYVIRNEKDGLENLEGSVADVVDHFISRMRQ